MLRWVARVLRIGLFAVGLLLLTAIPISYVVLVTAESPWPRSVTHASIGGGYLRLWAFDDGQQRRAPFDFRTEVGRRGGTASMHAAWPSLLPSFYITDRVGTPDDDWVTIIVPLWLLSAICLAWPVTSFIIHRRRHKRGFPVIQPEVSGQKSEVSQMSDAP